MCVRWGTDALIARQEGPTRCGGLPRHRGSGLVNGDSVTHSDTESPFTLDAAARARIPSPAPALASLQTQLAAFRRSSCEHTFVSYVELHCHSAFSFLDGASLPDELVPRALELGYGAMA